MIQETIWALLMHSKIYYNALSELLGSGDSNEYSLQVFGAKITNKIDVVPLRIYLKYLCT